MLSGRVHHQAADPDLDLSRGVLCLRLRLGSLAVHRLSVYSRAIPGLNGKCASTEAGEQQRG